MHYKLVLENTKKKTKDFIHVIKIIHVKVYLKYNYTYKLFLFNFLLNLKLNLLQDKQK